MTLITNVLRNDFIIMAGDRRTIRSGGAKGPNTKKLFAGKNYCIGIEGTIEASGFSILHEVTGFIDTNQYLIPKEIKPVILHKVFIPNNVDSSYTGLRLTISGFYQDRLFSYYYCTCCNQLSDLIVTDKHKIRFNQFNHKDYGLFNYAVYGGPENLSELTNLSDLFGSLQKVYKRISSQFNDIGELEDSCVIFKDKMEWLTI